jgi:hypothetical protein
LAIRATTTTWSSLAYTPLFLKFHNRVVDLVRSEGGTGDDEDDHDSAFTHSSADHDRVFRRARRLTTWHYQWILVHEFLPQILGQAIVNDISARGPRFFRPDRSGYMPVEFQAAAYRFGHSMVRPSYRANLKGNHDGGPFFGFIFDTGQNGRDDPEDLRGGKRAPRRFVGWQTFFKFDDPVAAAEVKPNKKIDTRISTPLFMLTPGVIPGVEQTPISLPARNLLRQVTWGMPSGQAIANVMGAPRVSKGDFAELRAYGDLEI